MGGRQILYQLGIAPWGVAVEMVFPRGIFFIIAFKTVFPFQLYTSTNTTVTTIFIHCKG